MRIIDTKLSKIKENKDGQVEIYAELNRKQFNQVQNGEAEIMVPLGVTMKNKAGSRALFFQCEDKLIARELEEGLDACYISWQENFVENRR